MRSAAAAASSDGFNGAMLAIVLAHALLAAPGSEGGDNPGVPAHRDGAVGQLLAAHGRHLARGAVVGAGTTLVQPARLLALLRPARVRRVARLDPHLRHSRPRSRYIAPCATLPYASPSCSPGLQRHWVLRGTAIMVVLYRPLESKKDDAAYSWRCWWMTDVREARASATPANKLTGLLRAVPVRSNYSLRLRTARRYTASDVTMYRGLGRL
eukprot:scaffold2549_cov343-Prasinococcus_capsulatus_cf.AAC.7